MSALRDSENSSLLFSTVCYASKPKVKKKSNNSKDVEIE